MARTRGFSTLVGTRRVPRDRFHGGINDRGENSEPINISMTLNGFSHPDLLPVCSYQRMDIFLYERILMDLSSLAFY